MKNDGFDSMGGETAEVTKEEVQAAFAETPVNEEVIETEETPNEEVEEVQEEAATEETLAEEEKSTEEEEEKTETEEEVDLYDDLNEPEKEPGDNNSTDLDLEKYSKKYGVEAKSIDELIEKVANKEGQEPMFASDELKHVFEMANQIHKDGGDFRSVFDTNSRLKEAEAKYESAKTQGETLQQYLETEDLEHKKAYLRFHYKDEMKLKGNLLEKSLETLEEMGDAELAILANSKILSSMSLNVESVSASKRKFEGIKGEQESLVAETAQRAKEAQAVIAKSINNFKDPDSNVYTSKTQRTSQKAFNTAQSTYMMPKGVAELLFTTNGVMDVDKVLNLINLSTNANDKLEHVSKKAKQNYFRNLKGQKKPDSLTRSTITETQSDDDGWDKINYGAERDYNEEVLGS